MAFYIAYDSIEYEIDYFFESLLYRYIIDLNIKPNEKSIMIFIARKTIGFKKLTDHIGIQEFIYNSMLKEVAVKNTIKSLLYQNLIKKNQSVGGKTKSRSRFSEYAINDQVMCKVLDMWIDIKMENKFIS